jgi:pimeloyl-ACP methyl ester carboxylesterase
MTAGNRYLYRVSVNGITNDYLKFGQGANVLVILPGLSVQSVMPLADSIVKSYDIFASDFTVYLFDRRKNLPADYSIYDIAEDTYNVLKALDLENICLFGASQGGMAAMVLASRHGDIVKKAVFGSASPYIDLGNDGVVRSWISLAQKGDWVSLALDFAAKLYPRDVFENYREVFAASAQQYTQEDIRRFITLAKGTLGFDIRSELNKIKCPVLALGSRDDNVLGQEGTLETSRLLANTDNCEAYIYDGFGHASFDTAPDYKERMYHFFMKNP